jgi:hypothetical protein
VVDPEHAVTLSLGRITNADDLVADVEQGLG